MMNPIKRIRVLIKSLDLDLPFNKKLSTKKRLNVCFFLAVPHFIVSLILIYFFTDKWIGILVLGVFLSDASLGVHYFIKGISKKFLDKFFNLWQISKFNHYLLFSSVIVLLFLREYIIASSGIIHLVLDWFGF